MKSITYLGSADDVVYRYPWSEGGHDEDSLWHELTHAIIYDQRIALNDGYIVANPLLVNSLDRLDTSILGNALFLGNAFLFSRGDPENLAEALAESAEKIETHRNIFKAKPELSGNLEILQKYVDKWSVSWPAKNMGEIFYTLVKNNLDEAEFDEIPEEVVNRVWNKFETSLNSKFEQARQTWEEVCWEVVAEVDFKKDYPDPLCKSLSKNPEYKKIRSLMNLANIAYHTGYSSALAHSLKQKPNGNLLDREICPLTSLEYADLSFFKKEEVEDFEDLEDRVQYLGTLLITVDRLKFKDKNDFQWTQAFELRSDLRTLRSEYLEALDNYINGCSTLLEAKKVADEYRSEIAKLLAGRVIDGVEILEDVVKELAPAVKVIRFLEKIMDYKALKTPLNHLGITPIKKFIAHESLVNKLEAEGIKSNMLGNNVKLARKLGLVNAPLASERMDKLIEPITSFEASGK